MALRIAHKINRHIVQNVSRSLSAKRDTDLESTVQKVEDVSKPAETPVQFSTPSIVYEVCRPRTTPVAPFPNSVQNESDAVRKTVALQHLQPAMLPEYYKPPIEINSACMGFDNVCENVTKYRKFEESNTFKNITLPLKTPKLASPFPEPVKMMPSHQVSDQEKAEQMLAESKAVKNTITKNIGSMPSRRSYTTGSTATSGAKDKKCKLDKTKEAKKKCHKIKVPFCAPVKSFKCNKRKKKATQCVRKPPPYPSYSETCHEDPYNKPSECKICPYKGDEHPSFKPPKTSFHTFSSFSSKGPAKISLKAGVIKKKDAHTEAKRRPAPTQDKKEAKKTEEVAAVAVSKPSYTSTVSLANEMGTWLDRLQPEDILLPAVNRMYEMNAAEEEETGGKCKKFPFKECTFTIVKERKPSIQHNRKCPPKEKPKLVRDCPAESEEKCKKKTSGIKEMIAYFTADKDGKEEKKKCPKVNLGICQDPRDVTDDPCRRKRTGKTLICPNDLLKKGRHKDKTKKTSGVIPPLGRIPSMPKSETTIHT